MEMVKKLHMIMRPFMLRRTKKELVVQLPDKIEINIQVKLSQLQVEVYCQFLSRIIGKVIHLNKNALVKTNVAEAVNNNPNNLLMQLRKVCNHPYLFNGIEPEGADEFGEHLVEASGKLTIVDKLLKKILKKKE